MQYLFALLQIISLSIGLVQAPSESVALTIERKFIGADVGLMRVHFSPDGSTILTASSGGVGNLWTLTGKSLAKLEGQKPPMFDANFSPDGKTLITTGYDGTIRLWDDRGQMLEQLQPDRAAVADALFSPDGRLIVTCSDDGQTQIFTRSGKRLAKILESGTARNLAYNPQGTLVASVSDSGSLYLLTPSGTVRRQIATGQGRINNVSFSQNGQQILTASINGTAKLWSLSGKLITTLKATTTGWVSSAQFDPNGKWIATASDDGVVRFWQKDGELRARLPLAEEKLTSLAFSPDGSKIAVVSNKGHVWIADVSAK